MNEDFDDSERALARHFEGLEAPPGVRRWRQAPPGRQRHLAAAPRRPQALAVAAVLALGVGITGGALGLRGSHQGMTGAGGAAMAPSARVGAAMAFDGTGVMLFGGSDGRQSLGDTWRWDGSRWAQLHPQHAPTARDHAAAVYDQRSGRVLLIGGSSTTLAPEPAPKRGDGQAVLGRPCFIVDSNVHSGKALPPSPLPANGGNCESFSGHPDEVWSWDGNDWSRRPGLPAGGTVLGATSDGAGGVVIDEVVPSLPARQGGVICAVARPAGSGSAAASAPGSAPGAASDPAATAQALPPGAPPVDINPAPPFGCSIAPGLPAHRVVTGNGDRWRVGELSTPFFSPPGSALAYDFASHQVVGFVPTQSGYCGPGIMGVRAAPDGSGAPAAQPGMAVPDALPRPGIRCLATGTGVSASVCCPQTEYALRGGAWRQVATVQVPLLRATLSDPGRGLVGLGAPDGTVGGASATYGWDGHRWSLRPHANTPPERFGFASADDGHGRVLLFGGVGPGGGGMHEYGDLWSWDGSSWTRLAGSPAAALPSPPLAPSTPPCPVSGPLRGSAGASGAGAAPPGVPTGAGSAAGSPRPATGPSCGPGMMQPLQAPGVPGGPGTAVP